MQGLVVGDLRIEAVDDAATPAVQLLWRGKSNNRHPSEALVPYFREVLATAVTRKLPIELHFEKLEHFNSSTITSVIELIQEARGKSVPLVIHYDGKVTWQKVTFEALRVFVKNDGLLELRAQ